MNTKEAIKLVGGSITIYVIMAACSATSGPLGSSSGDGGQGDGTASSGGSSASGGGGILDALTDPVPEANADPDQSGTRLKAKFYGGTDGSKEFIGWHDSQRNEDCSVYPALDGTTRCMPTAVTASYYADSNCTQPIALVTVPACGAATAPGYVRATGVPSTPPIGGGHVFPVGSPASLPASAYTVGGTYAADAGACGPVFMYSCIAVAAAAWTSVTSTSTGYTVGAELPPSTFVQMTIQTEP
jgi:hypothetical protein